MATEGHEAIWSMGDDTPIAPLARRPRRVTASCARRSPRSPIRRSTRSASAPSCRWPWRSVASPICCGHRAGPPVVIDSPVLDHEGWSPAARLDGPSGGARRHLADLARGARARVRAGAAGPAGAVRRATGSTSSWCRTAPPAPSGADRIGPCVGRVDQELSRPAAARGPTWRSRPATCSTSTTSRCWWPSAHRPSIRGCAGARRRAGRRARRGGCWSRTRPSQRYRRAGAGLRKVWRGWGSARCLVSRRADFRRDRPRPARGALLPGGHRWPGSVGAEQIGGMMVARHRRAYAEAPPALEDPGFVRFRRPARRTPTRRRS